MYVDGPYQCQDKWDIAGTNLVYYSGMGFSDEVCRFLCSELPACTVYVWYANGVCQIRRDAFRPSSGNTGPSDQIARSCVKTDIQTLPPPPPPPPSPPPPVWLVDMNGQPPKEDVYLIRAAGPMPRTCPDANLITANVNCYWTGQFALKPFEGAHQAWVVRRTNNSSGSYYVSNYQRQYIASPACERSVWNFLPQCGNTDIDLVANWTGAQQEVFFEPVAGRRGGVRIRAAGRNCSERYLASVLACPGYSSLYWAPLNLRDSAFVFEMLPISASYPVPDLPVTPNPSRTPSPSPSPAPTPSPTSSPSASPAPASGPGSSPGASPAPGSSPSPGGSSPTTSPGSSPAASPGPAPAPAPECGRGMLTEAGGFVRAGPPTPSQPQNVVLAMLAMGSYPWFWGKSNVLGVAPDLVFSDCFAQHGFVGTLQYTRVPAKVVPGDSNVYVARTDRDVFVIVRGTDSKADWVSDFVAVWDEANTLFGITGSSVKLHAGFKDLYVSMADWLIPTVNNTYNALPPGAKIWVTGHSMGGAVAQIASLHLATRLGADKLGGVVGFASPRVGDAGYRALYDRLLGGRHLKFRAGSDPVSNVPPGALGYNDVGTSVMLCPDGVVKTAGPSQPQSAHDALSCEGLPLNQNFHWPLQYMHGIQRVYGNACTRAAMELPQCDVQENCRLTTDDYKDYCTACTQPGDCDYYGLENQYCDNMAPLVSSFTCKTKAPVGTACLYDRVCSSGHCVAGFCRACGEDKHCGLGEFCELSLLQPTSLWTCKPDMAVGDACERDSQCGSGVCDRLACRECRSDSQCNAPGESGRFCDTNPLLVDNTYGKCRWPKPTGSMCAADRQCGSGHCVTGFCRACNADSHCSGGAWCELAVVLQPTTAWTCK
ncbi:hypothetical protein HXX76_016080 [Chlamydomonas incerta]|uniref:Fungal lipase-type domain-containing protein n=1 Tax=Chlamydomonas incerta TaxID=51695 RepID=A0A835VR33_CHLIN|nr:hypothetical protein HXX76_016080 [Chlamydomonas incerta]|eukprot:KAG2422396.1 hypothetical protein HXX76_016080 [Chlamydomonas incerta]